MRHTVAFSKVEGDDIDRADESGAETAERLVGRLR